MPTKNKPCIHLLKSHNWKPIKKGTGYQGKPDYYWHIVSRNGRIIARSSETYSRKSGAVKSIKVAAQAFWFATSSSWDLYYDHSKPDVTLKSYL